MSYDREEKTIVQEILDNRHALEQMEGGYDYSDVKLALVIVGVVLIGIVAVHFITTGTFW